VSASLASRSSALDAGLIGKPQVRGMMPKGFRRLRPSATVGGPRRLDQRLCDARILDANELIEGVLAGSSFRSQGGNPIVERLFVVGLIARQGRGPICLAVAAGVTGEQRRRDEHAIALR
jgi:hypothetical protein